MKPSLESAIRITISQMLKGINTCMIAKVVGINKIKDGFVDVQPLVNKLDIDYVGLEYPVISYVPIVMPCTSTSAVVLPVNQGDLVLLVFSQNPIDSFKLGSSVEHDPSDLRSFDINDAIAIAGINTTQNNLWNPEKYVNGYNNDSLKIVHNIGTDVENHIELNSDGSINVKSNKEINADSPKVNAKDIIIEGVGSVKDFMLSHTHKYTDDGNVMETLIPTRI